MNKCDAKAMEIVAARARGRRSTGPDRPASPLPGPSKTKSQGGLAPRAAQPSRRLAALSESAVGGLLRVRRRRRRSPPSAAFSESADDSKGAVPPGAPRARLATFPERVAVCRRCPQRPAPEGRPAAVEGFPSRRVPQPLPPNRPPAQTPCPAPTPPGGLRPRIDPTRDRRRRVPPYSARGRRAPAARTRRRWPEPQPVHGPP